MDTGIRLNPGLVDFGKVDFLLDQALQRVPHVSGVILLTADGLLRARTEGLPLDMAQRMAAACTAVQSSSRGTSEFVVPEGDAVARNGNPVAPEHFDGGHWRRTLVEFDEGYVLVESAGQGTFLGIATGFDVNLQQVGTWSQDLVQSVGNVLGTTARQDVGGSVS
ncbi:roadblock/LC7 domain-containing protein [Streptomyces prunicolor]|uniref:roadblock/LC7 domain-containing protein n=1 Tax=Streptomyces prunicolor TaxID=67348 RepID=UPI000378CD9F|nr:roadblock/LC7 domain-containing protein [Streptomyces prunicolor]